MKVPAPDIVKKTRNCVATFIVYPTHIRHKNRIMEQSRESLALNSALLCFTVAQCHSIKM